MATATKEKTKQATLPLDEFRSSVDAAKRATLAKGPKPILANVLLEFDGERCKVSASNMEQSYSRSFACECDAFSVAVNADRLSKFLAASQGETITLRETKSGVKVAAESSEMTMQTANASEFPDVEEPSGEQRLSISVVTLSHALRRISAFYEEEEAKVGHLGGVTIDSRESTAISIVTGHLFVGIPLPIPPCGGAVRIPQAGLRIVQSVLDEDSDCELTLGENSLWAKCGDSLASTRIFEGRIHDYKRWLPKEDGERVTITGRTLAQLLSVASICTSEETQAVDVTVNKGRIEIMGAANEVGEARAESIINFDGTNTVRINAKWLGKVARACGPDEQLHVFFPRTNEPIIKFLIGDDTTVGIAKMAK